jgi:hypothetical protein
MLGLLVYIFTGNNILALIISLASLSHIFFDSFGSGNDMMYFWPLSKRKFSFLEYKEQEIKGDNLFSYYSNLVKIYSKNLTFWLEIFITIAAFFVFLK